LEQRQVDLWYVLLDNVAGSELLDKYRALFSDEERVREQRYLAQNARLQYLVGRALMRTVLSRYAPVVPQAWTFSFNPHGKPSIASPHVRSLEFNLSHTEGVLVLAVTAGAAVGIDVERQCRRPNARELAQRYFAPSEAATLESLPVEQLHERFFEFWTLKEAFIKACGTGLAMPLDHFAFTLAAGHAPRITFFAEVEERADQWQFAQLSLAAGYQIGLAVRQPESEGIMFRAWEAVPLVWQSEGRMLAPNQANRWSL
jgi:4'-phosphopantetheinyl transferase